MYGPFMLITRLSCTITSRPRIAGPRVVQLLFFVIFSFFLQQLSRMTPHFVLLVRSLWLTRPASCAQYACACTHARISFCLPILSSSHLLSHSDLTLKCPDTQTHTSHPHKSAIRTQRHKPAWTLTAHWHSQKVQWSISFPLNDSLTSYRTNTVFKFLSLISTFELGFGARTLLVTNFGNFSGFLFVTILLKHDSRVIIFSRCNFPRCLIALTHEITFGHLIPAWKMLGVIFPLSRFISLCCPSKFELSCSKDNDSWFLSRVLVWSPSPSPWRATATPIRESSTRYARIWVWWLVGMLRMWWFLSLVRSRRKLRK